MSEAKKKRGRPAKTPISADPIENTENPRDPNKGKRRARVSLHGDLKLEYPMEKLDLINFRYYWGKDDPERPGRIEYLKSRGYEHHTENGKNVMRPAGNSTHYLMRQPMAFYLEDKAEKAKIILAKSATQASIGEKEYAPNPKTGESHGGTSAKTRDGVNPYAE